MQEINYRIGLDIGIASVGWAALLNDEHNEPVHILDMGVRVFDKAENPKDGSALAVPRRNNRTARRRQRRKKLRVATVKKICEDNGLIQIQEFDKKLATGCCPDVYELRVRALDERISGENLAQILLYLAKHRGFRSTRKFESNNEENGKVLSATEANRKILKEGGYRTVGEMLFKDDAFRSYTSFSNKEYVLTTRNKADNYLHSIDRASLVEEVIKIFEAQRNYGNPFVTEQFEKEYLQIMQNQRSFDLGPGLQANGVKSPYAINGFQDKVGRCTFEKNEYRAPKASYSAECFSLLEKISHLKINDINGDYRILTSEQRNNIFELAHKQKDIKYSTLRKLLGLSETERFNMVSYNEKLKQGEHNKSIEKTERSKFYEMKNFHEFCKALNLEETIPDETTIDLLDKISEIITGFKNDDSRILELTKLGISEQHISELLKLSPSKYMHLSIVAMKKIIPGLKDGLTYDKACEAAGYDFRRDSNRERTKLLKGNVVQEVLNDITNPVVKRGVSQSIKVINAIILKYGSPQAINIELARDMAKNYKDRSADEKRMLKRADENSKIKEEIIELGFANPTGKDIVKYRLWKEQQELCLYTGKRIGISDLFGNSSTVDVDHIIPYSKSFDDSYHNKVLVYAGANREKGNRTPFEYLGNTDKWNDFVIRTNLYITDYKKKQRLFKEHFTKEEASEFKERNLNDTRYITKTVYNLIRQNLSFKNKATVVCVNGSITSYLRKRWALPVKDRTTDLHHSVDAVVIACVTPGIVHKITKYTQAREIAKSKGLVMIDEETGEVFDPKEYTNNEWDAMFGVKPPLPWSAFKDEIIIRTGKKPLEFILASRKVNCELNYPEWMMNENVIKEIFVSRMPRHKNTGSVHDATIRSPKIFDEGYVISKVPLSKLKLKAGEIENYYNPESDLLLYNALKERLIKYENDSEKAFAEPMYKPKSDGSRGPLVKRVKVVSKMTLGVPAASGIAANGDMIRIDIFCENGKYYMVPIYVADTVKKELPNRAVVANKPLTQWKVMNESDFVFSLYPNDLIMVAKKGGIKVTNNQGQKEEKTDKIFVYYNFADIATGSIKFSSDDNEYSGRLGIQSLQCFKKYTVDVLGNIQLVNKERRCDFR